MTTLQQKIQEKFLADRKHLKDLCCVASDAVHSSVDAGHTSKEIYMVFSGVAITLKPDGTYELEDTRGG